MVQARDAFVPHPPSVQIAARLDERGATECEHGKDPCYLRCGVARDNLGRWYAISFESRRAWLERAFPKTGPQ